MYRSVIVFSTLNTILLRYFDPLNLVFHDAKMKKKSLVSYLIHPPDKNHRWAGTVKLFEPKHGIGHPENYSFLHHEK